MGKLLENDTKNYVSISPMELLMYYHNHAPRYFVLVYIYLPARVSQRLKGNIIEFGKYTGSWIR